METDRNDHDHDSAPFNDANLSETARTEVVIHPKKVGPAILCPKYVTNSDEETDAGTAGIAHKRESDAATVAEGVVVRNMQI